MKILVMGAGYVGICTAVQFSRTGNHVDLYDVDLERINTYKNGSTPFYEPGLTEKININVANRNLNFVSSISENSYEYDLAMICVGTPSTIEGYSNLVFVKSAIKEAINIVKFNGVIAIRSTCPPSSYSEFQATINLSSKKQTLVCYPEFLREGSAINDMENPDRLVIGCEAEIAPEILEIFNYSNAPKVITNLSTASLIKYSNNALLATLITFANSLAFIAEHSTNNIYFGKLLEALFLDRRWKFDLSHEPPGISSYIKPGIGYGGSCLPKDVKALSKEVEDEIFFSMIDTLNTNRTKIYYEYLRKKMIKKEIKKVLVLGISFKEGTDDLRDSKALELFELFSKDYETKFIDSIVKFKNGDSLFYSQIQIDDLKALHFKPDLVVVTNNDENLVKEISQVLAKDTTLYVFSRYQTNRYHLDEL